MASIFKKQQEVNEHPNRNNFDLSFKSNLSMKFGTLYPVFCKPVVPGDSFSIDTAFNLKLQPVVFPVQTKMRAHMHYFYVRNKNLWDNWENWISNLVSNTEHPHPYISVDDSKFKCGSIHDYLGVPTSLIGRLPRFSSVPFVMDSSAVFAAYTSNYTSDTVNDSTPWSESNSYANIYTSVTNFSIPDNGELRFVCPRQVLEGFTPFDNAILYFRFYSETYAHYFEGSYRVDTFSNVVNQRDPIEFNVTIPEIIIPSLRAFITAHPDTSPCLVVRSTAAYDSGAFGTAPSMQYVVSDDVDFLDYSETNLDLYSNYLHINALPYRAYESIYYAYYNNSVINPLKIGGQVQYNRYNTNLGDGADTTDYHLFQRNYELDFLTSSLPSPQQGVAPVVGMTALGDVTIEDENGITTAHAEIDDDGTISKVVLTSPAASIDHARTAMNIAACGMSINDFRATNALQRFLETSIRKGYKYRDFIAGHFGKEPEYRELDMAEFIGGFSRDVSVSTVVSNADTLSDDGVNGAALGQYGGFAQVVGGSQSSIRHYCDDYGYIIGILSVVPTPCYSQLLPKHMIAPDNFLDYYFNEFANLGMQPVTYKEVAPIQSFVDSIFDDSKTLEDTFGYQRPNYDLISSVDEIHGDFRGSLRNWVINRIFDTRPELGQSFISINPDEINDIFVDTNPDEDTIIGEIGFSVHAKRPIPRVVIPNLGK